MGRGVHEFGRQLRRDAEPNQDLDGFSETEMGNESQPDEEQIDEEGEEEMDRNEAASTTVRFVCINVYWKESFSGFYLTNINIY